MANKKEQIAQAVARLVRAGEPVALETVDFSDPNRPKTCLEVDFPILPVNQVAVIEGNAGKPIYQMSKWWARRRSSVFRAMLIAAATRAPDDPTQAARHVWEHYYCNHQKKGAFAHLKVADIFMGGGTTLVEGSRLGMQMTGNDLNPVAWFVVKQELADVDIAEVKRLLADIERVVKPQIMPFYACDGPTGEKGTWTHLPSGRVMGDDFDPLALTPEERPDYRYDGPEIIYTFWAKHGPCQVTGCGHRTPIMSSPVMAVKTLTVKHWPQVCGRCGGAFDVEDRSARMAPDVPLVLAPGEKPYVLRRADGSYACPHCGQQTTQKLERGENKKVPLTLLVHPQWLAGSPRADAEGRPFGGAAQDDAESTARWNTERAGKLRLLEVRGELPERVTCPETGVTFKTDEGTVPGKSRYTCAACGTVQDVLKSMTASGGRAQMTAYAIQGFSPTLQAAGDAYGGRFFAPVRDVRALTAAQFEWEHRRDGPLKPFWPDASVPQGFKTTYQRIPEHGYPRFVDMFNARQLLVHTQVLKAIMTASGAPYELKTREVALAALQQYLRNQTMLCLWNTTADKLEPHFSNNNYYPKNTPVENCVFGELGRGNWTSCAEGAIESAQWAQDPWELVALERFPSEVLGGVAASKSEKVRIGDPVAAASLCCGSSTDALPVEASSIDLVITDPPFGNNVQYAELADFFHVWLRLALADRYAPFGPALTPKALEAVDNPVRNPGESAAFFQRLLTQCWREAHRILKPGGILAFTFHHSEDEPWVAVLESLFDAGFYLEATYPIRSDETKGEGAKPGTFGSQTIEFDIIHVCRKRTEEPQPVSWARMRREVLAEVRQLQTLLEAHAKDGLPAADLEIIRRGKALEYYSRHYGRVYAGEDRVIGVKDAIVGIRGLIDDEAQKGTPAPPAGCEPMTRQFLRIFDTRTEVERDQMQKYLRGSGVTPDEFVQRGWCAKQGKDKRYMLVPPLAFAEAWYGRHRKRLVADLDQALVLVGACHPGSGIDAMQTLRNENFRPHPALKPLLEWFAERAAEADTRAAARTALALYAQWAEAHKEQVRQMQLFTDEALA